MHTRYALISDIHSNVGALGVVLDDHATRDVNTIINLGDILYGPIEPLATFELLRSHDIVTIRGNQDREIYEATSQNAAQNPTLAFILGDLGSEPVSWLRSLPSTASIDNRIFARHGTPTSDTRFLLEDVSSGHPTIRDDTEIQLAIADISEPVVACGHSHLSNIVNLESSTL